MTVLNTNAKCVRMIRDKVQFNNRVLKLATNISLAELSLKIIIPFNSYSGSLKNNMRSIIIFCTRKQEYPIMRKI